MCRGAGAQLRDLVVLEVHDWIEIAAAIVTTASCTPRMRTAGSPSDHTDDDGDGDPDERGDRPRQARARRPARGRPLVEPSAIIRAMKNAAMPASDICARVICPV